MAIEFLLVTYPDQREVLADGAKVGSTNHTLIMPSDEYIITLEGEGYQPPSQDVVLTGTSEGKPMVISFVPTTKAAATGSPKASLKPSPADSRRKVKNV